MKLKFVSEKEIGQKGGGRKSVYPWAEFMEEIYKHPNDWAEFPMTVPHAAMAYKQKEKYADIEIILRHGNNLALDHKDKRWWTVYIRYVPKTGPQNGEQVHLTE
jgi:hypothetical protein